MIQRKQAIMFSLLGLVIVSAVVVLYWLPDKNRLSLDDLNHNLDVADIKFGMLEEEVIELWGAGQYLHGFGGHGRDYKEQGVQISFPGDADNDLYGRVGGLELVSADHSVYAIRVGDEQEAAAQQLLSYGFVESDFSEDIFVQGEFMIALHGSPVIEFIQVWFDDKDLKDRNY